MKILAIDSSGLVASVAITEDDVLLGEYTIDYKKTHSQTLLPMLDELKRMLEMDMDSIDAIAVAAGPGSFTGLRIGSATAKGLGLALHKPLIAVPTVDGLAMNLWGCRTDICPLMDARRNQTYTGIYRFDEDCRLFVVEPQCAVDIMDIIAKINANNQEVTFLGDGVPVFRETIEREVKVPFVFAPAGINRQRASALALLGAQYYAEGRTVSAEDFRPDYLRLSQAERERLEKEKTC
ncbi:MAG: tRNA (adenosine(37)-N6)-threonylcarbamoyltransferase complex dimerization subunit type 1 TsaB [Lachnospiraceae bacterium]|nr:tRNA (adenosine(37)-N6)-threonylcarbamoyltransferase complex dimerization subunit type 1 TsaB [Lachnospiraceae bacterium]